MNLQFWRQVTGKGRIGGRPTMPGGTRPGDHDRLPTELRHLDPELVE